MSDILDKIRDRTWNAPLLSVGLADDYADAVVFEEEDGLEIIANIPTYYSDVSQNIIAQGIVDAYEDRRRLLVALEYVLEYGNEYTMRDLREMADEALTWERKEHE